MRRRIFWLVFGGDQTLAVMQSAPVCFHPDETDTALPLLLYVFRVAQAPGLTAAMMSI